MITSSFDFTAGAILGYALCYVVMVQLKGFAEEVKEYLEQFDEE